jgi:hypothetical protein
MGFADNLDSKFDEAGQYWHLEDLYRALARQKGKSLSTLEKLCLRALLLGFSPKQICQTIYGTSDSRNLRPTLSRALYRFLENLIKEETGLELDIKSCRTIILLEQMGYRSALMDPIYKSDSNIRVSITGDE